MLIVPTELALHALGLLQHDIQNAPVQLELLPLLGLGCRRFLEKQRTIGLPQINRRDLHARAREACEISFIHPDRQRRKPRGRADMLGHLLV